LRTKYYWAHINDVSVEVVKALLPKAEIIVDGDCGSVWGERHDCPYPHVLVKDPKRSDLKQLRAFHIGYVADKLPDWGARVEDFDWV